MPKIRVGVIRGGPSSEHEVSLETGRAMLEHLPEHYEGVDIIIGRDGVWRIGGEPVRLDELGDFVEVILNGLHGEYGEDGQVQRELDRFGMPYTGSGTAPSATAFNKELTKEFFNRHGIKTPLHVTLAAGAVSDVRLREIFSTHAPPYVVKPVRAGSSVATYIAHTLPELVEGVHSAFAQGFDEVLVEEYIKGREGTCGVIDDFRGEKHYALPPIEIVPPPDAAFFDYRVKYDGSTREICPGNFTHEEKQTMQDAARAIHEALGLSHYSRSDFIVSPRGVYALEVNTLPGMTLESLLPKALDAVGMSYQDFLDHLVRLAYRPA